MSEEFELSARARRMKPSAIRAMTRMAAAAGPDLISFAGGMPNPKTFPLEQLAAIAAGQIRDHGGKNLQYGLTAGYRPLVQWICDYMAIHGIQASAENVICTSGSQQALDLITAVLIDSDDYVFVEIPSYIGALAVFASSGANLRAIRQDGDGVVIEHLEEQLRSAPREKRKLIYLISNFQNPSGVSISQQRRIKIAELLDPYNAYLVEDDPYGELYFGGEHKPPAAIKTLAPSRTIYLGTFSKLIAPTFRTGWIVAPEPIARRVELAKEAADLCSSMLDQRIVHAFCSSRDFGSHVDQLRAFYALRYDWMESALQRFMPRELHWTHPTGGFFVWVQLPEKLDSESFLQESISVHKVSYVIGRAFTFNDSGRNFLRLAFSVEEPERIKVGISRLADLIRSRLQA